MRFPKRKKILVGVVLGISLGLWLYKEVMTPTAVKELRWVGKADPIADAKTALAQGRHSLRGIYGLGLSVPHSLADLPAKFSAAYGVDPIRGTTDGLLSDEHAFLVGQAAQYARAYNDYILTHYRPTTPAFPQPTFPP
jgi:hypothetical protein